MRVTIVFFLFFGTICSAQKADYVSILKKMDSLNQVKLDTGIDMMSTERSYFLNLHKFMNKVYDDLLENKTSTDLSREQMEWVKSFEKESSEIWKPITDTIDKTMELGRDDRLIAYGEQADLVYNRIIELIEKF
jgi:hypothetical protein